MRWRFSSYGEFFKNLLFSTQTMFSMLVFIGRDPGDATNKVSGCVEPSYCFKNRDFDASIRVPLQSIARKRNYGKS